MRKKELYFKSSFFAFAIGVKRQQCRVSGDCNLTSGHFATHCREQHRPLVDFPFYLQVVIAAKEDNHMKSIIIYYIILYIL